MKIMLYGHPGFLPSQPSQKSICTMFLFITYELYANDLTHSYLYSPVYTSISYNYYVSCEALEIKKCLIFHICRRLVPDLADKAALEWCFCIAHALGMKHAHAHLTVEGRGHTLPSCTLQPTQLLFTCQHTATTHNMLVNISKSPSDSLL